MSWDWWTRNSAGIGALANSVMAAMAVAALAGVAVQVLVSERQQKAQAARDLYRESLTLAIANPDLARPRDACALLGSDKAPAYVAFVDHLLYSAEQATTLDESWAPVFAEALAPHQVLLCSEPPGPDDYPAPVAALLEQYRQDHCAAAPRCAAAPAQLFP